MRACPSALGRWKVWEDRYGFCYLPAPAVGITLYLVDVLEHSVLAAPINTAVLAIAWAHKKACFSSPVDGMVEQVVQAAR